jgi:adenylyltransferase/sulfurtransferase
VVREISVEQLAAKLTSEKDSIVLVDVRQPREHALAALPGSVLIPLNELEQRAGELTFPENRQVVVYCHHGIRSLTGGAILERCGFQNVVSLAGGIDAWSLRIDRSVPRY